MMAGWLTQWVSTIFKGPYFLYLKERWEGRKIVGLIIHLRRYVLKKIPEEVRKEHDIDKVLEDQDKVEKQAKKIDKKGFRLGFHVEIDEEKALKIIDKIERVWIRARFKAMKSKNVAFNNALNRIEEEFQNELMKVLYEGEREEREIYWKYLEPIIRVAEKSGDHATIMQKVALLFKKEDVSRLASIAFRWEARGERKAVVNLKKDEREIEKLLAELDKKDVNPGRIAKNLRVCVKMVTEHAKNEFRNTYLLWKRDFLLNLVMLRLLDIDEREMMQFIRENIMPKAPEIKNIQDVEEIKNSLAKNAHVLAQGFRRLMGEEKSIIVLAERERAEARKAA